LIAPIPDVWEWRCTHIESLVLQNIFSESKPAMHKKITEIVANEFGEQSFSFIAPDGYFWTLIESGL
jgi:hypothetical protein